MNHIGVSGPPWLVDVAEPSDPTTIEADLSVALETLVASQPEGQPDVTVVVRAVDDRCDELLRTFNLVPDHDRWVQSLAGPASRNDFAVRQGQANDLATIVDVCARSRNWGEIEGSGPDAVSLATAITDGRVWIHERKRRLVCALVVATNDGSALRTIERLGALSSPDDSYTGPREDLDRSLALQTLKATLWALLGDSPESDSPASGSPASDSDTAQTVVSEIRVSVAADDFDGVALFEAAKLRYRHTDRFYRLRGSSPLQHP